MLKRYRLVLGVLGLAMGGASVWAYFVSPEVESRFWFAVMPTVVGIIVIVFAVKSN